MDNCNVHDNDKVQTKASRCLDAVETSLSPDKKLHYEVHSDDDDDAVNFELTREVGIASAVRSAVSVSDATLLELLQPPLLCPSSLLLRHSSIVTDGLHEHDVQGGAGGLAAGLG